MARHGNGRNGDAWHRILLPVLLSSFILAFFSRCANHSGTGPAPSTANGDTLSSESGYFQGVFFAEPSRPIVGENTVRIRLMDRAGTAVGGADVSATPWMPAHNHGSTKEPTVENRGGGEFLVKGVHYTMPGSWELRIQVKTDSLQDNFTARYEVPE